MKLGPDSAGYRLGTCWPKSGVEPFRFGQNEPQPHQGVKVPIVDPLGLSVDEATEVIELRDLSRHEYLRAKSAPNATTPPISSASPTVEGGSACELAGAGRRSSVGWWR